MKHAEYLRYLKSYDWQVRRQRALKAAGYHCQICRSETRLEVHHNNYDNLGDEQPSDLIVLCHDCHDYVSRRIPDRPHGFLERLGWAIEDVCHD